MPEIRPFQGVRYNQTIVGDLANVVAAPYDVISPAAQRALEQRSPYNVVRLELGADLPTDTLTENRYSRAAALYGDWRRHRVLVPDPTPRLYVYDEEFGSLGRRFTRRSLVAAVKLADWSEGVVFPHEHTLPRAKADRLSLLTAAKTQFSPLLATFDDPGGVATELSSIVRDQPPTAEFQLEPGQVAAAAQGHRVWDVSSAASIDELLHALARMPIYIADGHHRYETALTYRDLRRSLGAEPNSASEYVLIGLVDMNDPGLLVLPTHRLVSGLADFDRPTIIAGLRRYFDVTSQTSSGLSDASPPAPAGSSDRPSFAVIGLESGLVHQLRLRSDIDLADLLPGVPDVLRVVDTLVLQRLVLEQVLGLSADEAEVGDRIQYTRDPAEAARAIDEGVAQLVVFLNPTPVAQIRAAARAGARMPQKTTYFYPKPVTGVVLFDHLAAWS